ncbi:MAG: hypothetical protein E6Q78_05185 [Rhodoferax sp.]|nr:MAG: hypothetical protein E6Q78_05185 [Rhodoferax sp.]
MKTPFEKLNVTHCDAVGVSKVRLHHQSIQVCHLSNGNTVLTCSESGRDPVLFELTPSQRQHFIGLLSPALANTAQPATENVAQGA